MADGTLVIDYGDTWSFSVTVQDDSTPPVAIDLTNATIDFALETYDSSIADLLLEDPDPSGVTTPGITIDRTDASGLFEITCSHTVMKTLPPNTQYKFYCVVTFDAGHLIYPSWVMTVCNCLLQVEEHT